MPAGAPIVYWCSAEDIDHTLIGANCGSDGAITTDTAFQRGTMQCSFGSPTWPGANQISNPISFGNLSTFWWHSWYFITSSGAGVTLNYLPFGFGDPSNVARLFLRTNAATGGFKISTRTAAGVFADLPLVTNLSPMVQNVAGKIDIFVNYSTSGQVTVYWNGVVMCDTGPGVNVTTDGATALSFFYLQATLASAAANRYQEIIIADVDTRAARLWALQSSTAGNAQTWVGAASGLNKVTISDVTYVSAPSAGLIEQMKLGLALPAGTWQVAAVKLSSRALVGTIGPQHIQYVVRTGSTPTDYVGGSWTPPGPGSFYNDTQNYLLPLNPATGVPWTTADLTAATWNYGIVSAA